MKATIKIITLFSLFLCLFLSYTARGQNYTIKKERDAKDTTLFTLVYSNEIQKLVDKVLPGVEFYFYEFKNRKIALDDNDLVCPWVKYKNKDYFFEKRFNELLMDIDKGEKGKHLKKISEEEIIKTFLWIALSHCEFELMSIDSFCYLGEDYKFRFPNKPKAVGDVNYKISVKMKHYIMGIYDYLNEDLYLYIKDKQIKYIIKDTRNGYAYPFLFVDPVNVEPMPENSNKNYDINLINDTGVSTHLSSNNNTNNTYFHFIINDSQTHTTQFQVAGLSNPANYELRIYLHPSFVDPNTEVLIWQSSLNSNGITSNYFTPLNDNNDGYCVFRIYQNNILFAEIPNKYVVKEKIQTGAIGSVADYMIHYAFRFFYWQPGGMSNVDSCITDYNIEQDKKNKTIRRKNIKG